MAKSDRKSWRLKLIGASSDLLLIAIIFLMLATILEVKIGFLVAILSIAFLYCLTSGSQSTARARDNYISLSVISGTYALLGAAILGSWVNKVKDIEWQTLDKTAAIGLVFDLLSLTFLVCVGVLIVGAFRDFKGKDGKYFAASKPKRFYHRRRDTDK